MSSTSSNSLPSFPGKDGDFLMAGGGRFLVEVISAVRGIVVIYFYEDRDLLRRVRDLKFCYVSRDGQGVLRWGFVFDGFYRFIDGLASEDEFRELFIPDSPVVSVDRFVVSSLSDDVGRGPSLSDVVEPLSVGRSGGDSVTVVNPPGTVDGLIAGVGDGLVGDDMDLLIVIYVDISHLSSYPLRTKDLFIERVCRNIPRKRGVRYFVFPCDRNDVVAVPVKCYLDGNGRVPEDLGVVLGEIRDVVLKCGRVV